MAARVDIFNDVFIRFSFLGLDFFVTGLILEIRDTDRFPFLPETLRRVAKNVAADVTPRRNAMRWRRGFTATYDIERGAHLS